MASKRSFGNIRQLPSGRYQVRYCVDGSYVTAPKTFAGRIDAEAHLTDRRREIDAKLWNPATAAKPERVTFGAYAASWLANRQVAGRPIKARTREHYQQILTTTYSTRSAPAAVHPTHLNSHARTTSPKHPSSGGKHV